MARTEKIDSEGNYWCNGCKQYKPLTSFFSCPPSHRGNKSTYCKTCSSENTYYQRQRDKLRSIGREAYKAELDQTAIRLENCYKLLEDLK